MRTLWGSCVFGLVAAVVVGLAFPTRAQVGFTFGSGDSSGGLSIGGGGDAGVLKSKPQKMKWRATRRRRRACGVAEGPAACATWAGRRIAKAAAASDHRQGSADQDDRDRRQGSRGDDRRRESRFKAEIGRGRADAFADQNRDDRVEEGRDARAFADRNRNDRVEEGRDAEFDAVRDAEACRQAEGGFRPNGTSRPTRQRPMTARRRSS